MTRNSRRPTLRDVADRAGVSQSTVSIVLSGRRSGAARISSATRQKVLDVAEALGYVPNQAARGLRRRSTERVCLAFQTLGEPYSDLIAADLRTLASEYGYSAIIQIFPPDEGPAHTLQQMRAGLADGLLLVYDPDEALAAELEQLVQMGIAVMVLSNLAHSAYFDVMRNGEYAASVEAIDYLVARGHTRIGLIHHHESGLQRYNAFYDRLAAHGFAAEPELLRAGAYTRKDAYAAAEALLALPQPPTAIFAGSDRAAISTMWAVQRAGRRVPDDVAVIGVGNIPEGELTHPRLTSVGPVSRDFRPMIRQLFQRIQGHATGTGLVLDMQWQFVIRESA
jgi:DNA-binding LacI/PurR family transcriptional regulator